MLREIKRRHYLLYVLNHETSGIPALITGFAAAANANPSVRLSRRLRPRPDWRRLRQRHLRMKATVFHGPRDVRVETVPDPIVKSPTDAIVRITRAAICGSDLHSYHGNQQVVPGFVLGHEGVGVVEEVGKAVSHLKKGQRVVVAGAVACGQCFFCRRGQVAQCSVSGAAVFGYGKNFAGTFGEIGGEQAEAVTVPLADYTCYALPDSIHDEAAIFLADILPTGYFGALIGDIRPGATVAIFGCGPVGLCATRAEQLFGPAEVIAVDELPYRLALARKLG